MVARRLGRRRYTPPMRSSAGRLLITTFGLGFMRPASGTWGSMPSVALAGLMMLTGVLPVGPTAWLYHGVLAAVLVLFSWVCVRFGPSAEAEFGKKDPGQVVADETAGQCLPLMLLPIATPDPLRIAVACAAAFLAFRVFDILKLPPARGLQRLSGGWGILIDDLIAGVQAVLVVQVLLRVAGPMLGF